MKKVVLLFPGQGSQIIGMGKWFYDHHPAAKQTFEEANDVLGWSVSDACFSGSLKELTSTDVVQPALLTTSIAMYRVYMEELGLRPFAAAGHSLGEFTALCSAGAISFQDALELVYFRGKTMKAASELGLGTMLAVNGIDFVTVEEQLKTIVSSREDACISCYNGPSQVVISGLYSNIERVAHYFRGIGAQVSQLQVGAACHHPSMQSSAEQLKDKLEQIQLKALQYKVLSNVTGNVLDLTRESFIEELTLQMTKPVQWNKTMSAMTYLGAELAIEMGPKSVLKQLWKRHNSIEALAYDVIEDRKQLVNQLTYSSNRAAQTYHPIAKILTIAASTPNHNISAKEVQSGIIEPYQQLLRLHTRFEQRKQQPTDSELEQGLQWLQLILRTKGIALEEQLALISEVNSI